MQRDHFVRIEQLRIGSARRFRFINTKCFVRRSRAMLHPITNLYANKEAAELASALNKARRRYLKAVAVEFYVMCMYVIEQ